MPESGPVPESGVAPAPAPPLLRLDGVSSWHGPLQALHDVSLDVFQGEVTAVLGSNGAGKSTLLGTVMGIIEGQPAVGTVEWEGRRVDGLPTERIVRAGIGYVPEGRRVFSELSVRENLAIGGYVQRDRAEERRWLKRVHDYFPVLADRRQQRAGTLSGGEQQMLAIGRALMNGPRLLMLDEPSLGLAPMLVRQVFEIIHHIREDGVTVLLVEQNARMALSVADRGVVLDGGTVVASGAAAELVDNHDVERLYMGS